MSSYPFVRPDMIMPLGDPIPTSAARRLYRQIMIELGYFTAPDAPQYVQAFATEVRDHESALRDEYLHEREYLREQIDEARSWAKELLEDSRDATTPDEKSSSLLEREEQLRTLAALKEELKAVAVEYASFRRDKRAFLVNYINTELHGSNWQARASFAKTEV
jgi:hypothetical protein